MGSGPAGICDVCGLRYPLSEMRKRWDNLIVCDADFEHRHPQDFVRAVRDKQAVRNARPEPDVAVSATTTVLTDHAGNALRDGIAPVFGDGDSLRDGTNG